MASPPLQMVVEILINGAWRDISKFVYQRDNVVIGGGKTEQMVGKYGRATMTLTLNNRDGRFSPNYAGGAYFPWLTRNVQIRMAAVFTNGSRRYDGYRFWGKVSSWPPLSDSTGKDIYVSITANGPLQKLSQKQNKDSALVRYYSQLTGNYQPIAYWPCEENPNSKTIGAAFTGGQNMKITSTNLPIWKAVDAFNGSAPVPIVNKSTWVGTTGSVSSPASNYLRAVVFVPSTGGNDGSIIIRWNTSGTITKVDLAYLKGGKLQVKGFNAGGTKLFDSGQRAHQADGNPIMVSVELTTSGSSINWRLRSCIAGAHSYTDDFGGTVASASVGPVTTVTVDPNSDVTRTAIAQLSVQYTAYNLLDLSSWLSDAVNGHDGEISMKRLTRILGEEALNFRYQPKEGHDHYGFDVNENYLSPQNSLFTGTTGTWGVDTTAGGINNAQADNMVYNPFFANSPGTDGWTGSNGGTGTASLSVVSPGFQNCPTLQAAQLVCAGATNPRIQNTYGVGNVGNLQPTYMGQSYTVTALVNTTVSATITAGASQVTSGGAFVSDISTSASVPANTWTTVTGTITVNNTTADLLSAFVQSNQGTSTLQVASVVISQPLLSNGSGWSMALTSQNAAAITTPGIPTSGSGNTVTNSTGVPITVVVSGGTGTNVYINGVAQGTFDGTYTVPVSGTIALLYTAAPTWTWTVSMYATHAPQSSLVGSFDYYMAGVAPTAWWKLNDLQGASSVLDYSGSGFNGTPAAGVTLGSLGAVAPWLQSGALFSGTGTGYIITTYTPPTFTAFSIGVWVNLNNATQTTTAPQIISCSNSGTTFKGFQLYYSPATGNIVLNLGVSGTSFTAFTVGSVSADGWHFVAATWNGTTLVTYLDGVQTSSTAYTGYVSDGVVSMGSNAGQTGQWFAGLLAEAAIDNSAWTQAQITNMYNGGTGYQATALGVLVGQYVDASAQFLAAQTSRTVRTSISFWSAAGVLISSSNPAGSADATGAWTSETDTHVVVPAGAMWARAEAWVLGVVGATETHYVYNCNIAVNNDIQGWGITNGTGTLSQDSSWSQEGTYSLNFAVTNTGVALAGSPTGTAGQPISGGDFVGAAVTVYCKAGTVSNAGAEIAFYNSGGTYISSITSTITEALGVGAYDTFTMSGTSPSTAAFFAVKFGDYASGGISGRSINGDMVIIGPPAGGQGPAVPHEIVKEIHELERGIMREERKLWGLGYRTRVKVINQTPSLTLDYNKGQIFGQLAPVVDESRITNDITIRRKKGSKQRVVLTIGAMSIQEPPNGIGKLPKSARVAAHDDAQLLAFAEHLLALATDGDERYPIIEVRLERTEMANIMDACAGVEIGDYVQIIKLPFWYPNNKVKQLVIGYQETITPFSWDIQWNCTPESPYEIQVLRRW